MTYKLIAMDLDGTLNNDAKEITERTSKRLMQAQEKGIRLALASARPLPGLYRERDALRLQDYGGILMACNGGHIVKADTGETLVRLGMDLEIARKQLKMLEDLPVTPIIDDGVRFYAEDIDGYKVRFESFNNRMPCTIVDNLADFLNYAPIKILMSVQPEQLLEVQKEIAKQLPEELTVVRTAPFYMEILPRTIHKGKGIQDICAALKIPTSEVISFGDAENDISMLKVSGVGVAMGNAEQSVKDVADMVTLSNNEDGIACALDKLL